MELKPKKQKTEAPDLLEGSEAQRRVRLMVSSVVLGYEDFLESLYAILQDFGYEVLMSHKGTIPIDPNISAMSSCLETVEK